MASITISPSTSTIKVGQTQVLTASVEGAAEGASIAYSWQIDGASTGETGSSYSFTNDKVGTYAIGVKATIGEGETAEEVSDEASVKVEALPEIGGLSLTISGPSSANVGEEFTLTASATSDESATYSYIWGNGSTGSELKVTETEAGSKTYTCTVVAKATGFADSTTNASKAVTVSEPVDVPDTYIHPLPHRNSAYIWAGWWVMDAIQKLTLEGKDWKSATEADTKYYQHLAVLAKMISDYPEVDVQESRNGYIIHKTALEAGIIY